MQNFYKMRNAKMSELFNKIACHYEKWRLSYPTELYKEIFSFCGEFQTALEIGIGTGKATKNFLERGIDVTAVEPSAEMLNIAKQKFNHFSNFCAVQMSFEEFFAKNERKVFDLVFAASSFQWLNSEDRLKMISALVKPNGVFARFKTVTILQSDLPTDKILYNLYQKFLPDFLPKDTSRTSFNEQLYKDAGFEQVIRKQFFKPVVFRRDDYISFANTYTEYLRLPEDTRINFESAIKNSIRADDNFNFQQKCSLIMARKNKDKHDENF